MARAEQLTIESYATWTRAMAHLTTAVEASLRTHGRVAELVPAAAARRHALARDLAVVGGFARALPPAARAAAHRCEHLTTERPYLAAAFSYVVHARPALVGRSDARAMGRSTGLKPVRGLESVARRAADLEAHRRAWGVALDQMALDAVSRDRLAAECLLAVALVEGVLKESAPLVSMTSNRAQV